MKIAFFKFFSVAICAVTLSVVFCDRGYSQDEEEKKDQPQTLAPTHKQIKVIRPELAIKESAEEDEKEAPSKKASKRSRPAPAMPALKTFCLAYDGTILAGLSANDQHALQFLSPDGELKQQVDLQFQPQVISQAPDGIIFIAGPGKLAKVSQAGKILTSVDAPWLGDPEELKKEVIAEMKERYSGIIENYQSTLDGLEKRI